MRRRALVALALALLAACEDTGARFAIVVRATHEGAPIAGVAISESGALVGETAGDGALHLETERPEGSELELTARCPGELRARPERLRGRLRTWWREADGQRTAPPLELAVRCERQLHDVVVVVDAGRADLEVRVDGRALGRTGPTGVAHLALQQPPRQRFAVAIDTSPFPDLAPASPERRFVVGNGDEVFYWAPSFERSEPEREREPRRRRRGRRGGGRLGIERLR